MKRHVGHLILAGFLTTFGWMVGCGGPEAPKANVNQPPVIAVQPADLTVNLMARGTFRVQASGAALSYSWTREGQAQVLGSAPTLELGPVKAEDHGTRYVVTVKNAAGSVTSRGALLTVNLPPACQAPPQDQSVVVGGTATFEVQATGRPDPSIQWLREGQPIQGATGSRYTTPPATLADHGTRFQVRLSNSVGQLDSSVAVLSVQAAGQGPKVELPLKDVEVQEGQPFSLVVNVSGTAPLEYLWQKDGVALSTTGNVHRVGAAGLRDAGRYVVQVRNAFGTADSGPVQVQVVQAPVRPTIIQEPQDKTVRAGEPARFEVVANGSQPLAYQWYRNGSEVADAKSAVLELTNVKAEDSGAVFVVKVSNAAGVTPSREARLTVISTVVKPVIDGFTATPGTVTAGQAVVLSWRVRGASGLSIEPEVGTVAGAPAEGTVTVHPTTQTTYTLTATNAAGPVSQTIPVYIRANPVVTVTVAPRAVELDPGRSQTFTASVEGTMDQTVTWSVVETGGGSIDQRGVYVAPATAGVYHVRALCQADQSRYDEATVTVKPTTPSAFSLVSISPSSLLVKPGTSGTTTVTVKRPTGHTAAIQVSLGNAPAGVTGAGTVPGGQDVLSLTLNVDAGVAPKDYAMNVNATDGTTSCGLSFTLRVTTGSVASTTYRPPAFLPDHGDGVPTTVQWIHGAPLFVKDNAGNDLVGFFKGTNSMHAAVSRDEGASWTWVDPSTRVDVDPVLALAQGADGRVHLISWSYGRGTSYGRLALMRDALGHVVDFKAEVQGIAFPSRPNTGDISADLVAGTDAAGRPTLFFALYDDPNTGSRGRIVAGKTRPSVGQAPMVSSDFVSLEHTSDASMLELLGNDAWGSPHNACVLMAQHPVSKDLWFQWGPANTADGLTLNTLPVKRLRATPNADGTYRLGTASTLATHTDGWGTQNYGVTTSADAVWFAYGSPACALHLDRADGNGNVQQDAIPSPYSVRHSGGWFTMAVDKSGTEMWLAGLTAWDSGDTSMPRYTSFGKHWDGSRWTTFTETVLPASVELFRISGSSGWDRGLVFVLSQFDYTHWRPAVGTLKTEP